MLCQNKIVLGICLGAQLIGKAMGSAAEKSPYKEIGVYSTTLNDEGKSDPITQDLGESFDVIHWHGEMMGLSSNSLVLAYSEGCPRQIVKYGEKVYGFQCHLEIKNDGIKEMIKECPEGLDQAKSKFIRSKDELLNYNYNNKMFKILDRFVELFYSNEAKNSIEYRTFTKDNHVHSVL